MLVLLRAILHTHPKKPTHVSNVFSHTLHLLTPELKNAFVGTVELKCFRTLLKNSYFAKKQIKINKSSCQGRFAYSTLGTKLRYIEFNIPKKKVSLY